MYRPEKIIDSHIHLLTAETNKAKLERMAKLDEKLIEAYHEQWEKSLASRKEAGPETSPADVETVAGKWAAEFDEAGIERGVFFTSDEVHDELARFTSLNPARFIGYTTFNPCEAKSRELLQRQIDENGIRGVKLYPMGRHFHVNAPECFSFYEVCQDNNIPVLIHFGISINATHDLKYGNPLDLSGPAVSFPAVKWIIPHFGTGFFRETLMLAAQYKNIYIDTSSSNNWIKYSPYTLTLKDLFDRSYATVGAKRILFGTDSSFFPRGYRKNILEEQLAICNELKLSREEIDDVFYGNIKIIIET